MYVSPIPPILLTPLRLVFAQVFRSVDVDTLSNLIAKNALETCLKTGLESARTRLHSQCTEIIRAYRNSGAYGSNNTTNMGHQLQLPESLQLLPLYIVWIPYSPTRMLADTLPLDVSAQECGLSWWQWSESGWAVFSSVWGAILDVLWDGIDTWVVAQQYVCERVQNVHISPTFCIACTSTCCWLPRAKWSECWRRMCWETTDCIATNLESLCGSSCVRWDLLVGGFLGALFVDRSIGGIDAFTEFIWCWKYGGYGFPTGNYVRRVDDEVITCAR